MDKKILHNVLDQVGLEYAERTAIEDNGRTLLYRDMVKQSNRVANAIIGQNAQPGDIIGVYIPSSIEYIYSIIGISKSGGVFMPLEVAYPAKRLEYLVAQAMPNVIITTEKYLPDLVGKLNGFDKKPAYVKSVLVVAADETNISVHQCNNGIPGQSRSHFYSTERPEVNITGDSSLYLLNTSGSTGNPKMIEGMHKSLSHFIHWEVGEFELDYNTKICQLARTSFDLSLREIFVPLMAGGTLCIPDTETKANTRKLLGWMKDSQITLVHIVPSVFRLLIKELQENPAMQGSADSIEYFLLAGEAVYGKDITDWKAVAGEKAQFVNMYGPSETTLAKVFYRINQKFEPQQIVPLGKPLPNTVVIILADGKLCNPGAIGEIHIKTPFRSKGYYKEQAMTAEKFIQNPLHNDFEDIVYRTGDLGKYLEDGTVAFVGRQDSQVKIRGNRVELTEVEQTVMKYQGIKQVIVIPIKNADSDNVLACYYTSVSGLSEDGLRDHLASYLPEYMHPSYYTRMEEFPLNLNGKIDRRMLPRPEEFLYTKLKYEAPADQLEQTLAKIWSVLLGLKKVGVNNPFLELGGHSLTVTKMLAGIYKDTGVEISLKEAFDNPTIRKLATLIRKKMGNSFRPIDIIPQQKSYELSYPQKAIWLAEQLEREEPVYNVPYGYIVKGNLDTDVCEKVFQALVDRHEILRTTFDLVEGEPRQIVHESQPFKLAVHDETARTDKERVIRQYLNEEAAHVFSLTDGPLMRARVVKLSSEEHLLLFTAHHIVFDGWSNDILIREFNALYKAYQDKRGNPLPPLRIQYKDFAAWYNQKLDGASVQKLRNYWLSRLESSLEPIQFPTDRNRVGEKTFRGKRAFFDLDSELIGIIEEVSRKHNCTPFMVCLAITSLLLYKYTGQRDMVVGSPIAGRDHKDLENQVGMYVNVLPIRIEIEADDTFESLLLKVKGWLLGAYEHQSYPYLMILEDLGLTHADEHAPLLDVLVQSGDMPAQSDNGPAGLQFFPCEIGNITSKAELTFDFLITGYQLSIEYNVDLFTPSTMEEIFTGITGLIKAIGTSSEQLIADLPLSLSSEKLEEEDEFRKLMSGI
jgi:mycobactin peptide synthetase MbtE